MVYGFFGSDTEKVRAAARACGESHGEPVRLTASDYRSGILTEYAESVSLFGSPMTIVVDTFSENAEALEALVANLASLAASVHTFIVIESALTAGQKKIFEKHATIEEYTAGKKEPFNIFQLTDAFCTRDKKALWLLLISARTAGIAPEEIAGILFWQIKTLRLVARTQSAEEAGVKPFVYTKTKPALSKFTPEDLDRLSRELVTIYHDGHRGVHDMDTALEGWMLSL